MGCQYYRVGPGGKELISGLKPDLFRVAAWAIKLRPPGGSLRPTAWEILSQTLWDIFSTKKMGARP